jgi:DNA-directed RNA polymerase specialized sigma24 family protein
LENLGPVDVVSLESFERKAVWLAMKGLSISEISTQLRLKPSSIEKMLATASRKISAASKPAEREKA